MTVTYNKYSRGKFGLEDSFTRKMFIYSIVTSIFASIYKVSNLNQQWIIVAAETRAITDLECVLLEHNFFFNMFTQKDEENSN
jgi:hypothetical protein